MPLTKENLDQKIKQLGEKRILSPEEVSKAISDKDVDVTEPNKPWGKHLKTAEMNIITFEDQLENLNKIYSDVNLIGKHVSIKHSKLAVPFEKAKAQLLVADESLRVCCSFLARNPKNSSHDKELSNLISRFHHLIDSYKASLEGYQRIKEACSVPNQNQEDARIHLLSDTSHHVNYNSLPAASSSSLTRTHVADKQQWWNFSRLSALFKSCYPINIQRKKKAALPNLESENSSRSRLPGSASQAGRQL